MIKRRQLEEEGVLWAVGVGGGEGGRIQEWPYGPTRAQTHSMFWGCHMWGQMELAPSTAHENVCTHTKLCEQQGLWPLPHPLWALPCPASHSCLAPRLSHCPQDHSHKVQAFPSMGLTVSEPGPPSQCCPNHWVPRGPSLLGPKRAWGGGSWRSLPLALRSTANILWLTVRTRHFVYVKLLTGHPLQYSLGFPAGSAGKESACNVGDLGLIPGLARSTGEGKGYPLQCSGLENSMDYA